MNQTLEKNEPRPADKRPPGAAVNASRPRRRGRTLVIIVVSAIVVLGGVWWVNHRRAAENPAGATGGGGGRRGGGGGRGFGNAPLPVNVRVAEKGDLHIYLNALGTVTPAHAATIRTQISGQLQKIAFQEGQLVHEGDPLAIIDPRPYQNALEQAQAQHRQAESQLRTAQLDLERYETLAKEDSIAKQQVDTTRAQVSQFEGVVQASQAAIDTATLNLSYCHINAPFEGRVGLRFVDTGNYVTPGDANGIVSLAQVHPINVVFTLAEDNMGRIAERMRSGTKLPVEAFDRSQVKALAAGTLVTIDNQIDPSTGTFKLRAEFANEDESLFPNQFVNVRLLLDTVHDAIVVPTSAIERGQQGTYVYVVQPDETAAARVVTLGPTEGERVGITSGLSLGDKVVVDGADKLKDGQKVILNASEASAPGRGGRGERGADGATGEGRKKGGPRGEKKAAPAGAGKE